MKIRLQDNQRDVVIDIELTSRELVEVIEPYLDYLAATSLDLVNIPDYLAEELLDEMDGLDSGHYFEIRGGGIHDLIQQIIELGEDDED